MNTAARPGSSIKNGGGNKLGLPNANNRDSGRDLSSNGATSQIPNIASEVKGRKERQALEPSQVQVEVKVQNSSKSKSPLKARGQAKTINKNAMAKLTRT